MYRRRTRNVYSCLGGPDEGIHISNVDYIVEGSNPEISILGSGSSCEEDIKIAKLLVDEIPTVHSYSLVLVECPIQ